MKFSPARFKVLLARRQATYLDFARETGIPAVTISQALRGVRNPTLRTIGRLAAGLGVDVTEIIEQEEHNEK